MAQREEMLRWKTSKISRTFPKRKSTDELVRKVLGGKHEYRQVKIVPQKKGVIKRKIIVGLQFAQFANRQLFDK